MCSQSILSMMTLVYLQDNTACFNNFFFSVRTFSRYYALGCLTLRIHRSLLRLVVWPLRRKDFQMASLNLGSEKREWWDVQWCPNKWPPGNGMIHSEKQLQMIQFRFKPFFDVYIQYITYIYIYMYIYVRNDMHA